LNILLFGQGELETIIAAKGNLADRVDGWIRLGRLDEAMSSAVLDFRLQRAGLTPGQHVFTPDARALLIEAAEGLPRRLTMIAHLAMEESVDRASTLVNEDHVYSALAARGIEVQPKPVITVVGESALDGEEPVEPGFFRRLFPRRSTR